jgi:hypothetical protein
VQLIFDRRVRKRTPGRFRTRVLTDGVIPSLHIDSKNSRIKPYYKPVPEVREVGARTETTIHNTRDFSIGKRRCNLPAPRQVGFPANRRVLEVERLSQDCAVGEEAMLKLNRPVEVSGQRAAPCASPTSAYWLSGACWSGFVGCLVGSVSVLKYRRSTLR